VYYHPGTSIIAYWRDRGSSLIETANLSLVTKLVAGTGAGRGTKLVEARKLSKYTGLYLRADARVRVQEPLQICL